MVDGDIITDAAQLAVACHRSREIMAGLASAGDNNALEYFQAMGKVSRDVQRKIFGGVTADGYLRRVRRAMLTVPQ